MLVRGEGVRRAHRVLGRIHCGPLRGHQRKSDLTAKRREQVAAATTAGYDRIRRGTSVPADRIGVTQLLITAVRPMAEPA
jgi:hypothetical protein